MTWWPYKGAAPIYIPWWAYRLFPFRCYDCQDRVRSFDQHSAHIFRHNRDRMRAYLEKITDSKLRGELTRRYHLDQEINKAIIKRLRFW